MHEGLSFYIPIAMSIPEGVMEVKQNVSDSCSCMNTCVSVSFSLSFV